MHGRRVAHLFNRPEDTGLEVDPVLQVHHHRLPAELPGQVGARWNGSTAPRSSRQLLSNASTVLVVDAGRPRSCRRFPSLANPFYTAYTEVYDDTGADTVQR